jgi:hypothetical protein
MELKLGLCNFSQSDINQREKAEIINEIVEVLNDVFPDFAQKITGKIDSGRNRVLLKDWFTHATIAAPFFNMDFFYPELKEIGKFLCLAPKFQNKFKYQNTNDQNKNHVS